MAMRICSNSLYDVSVVYLQEHVSLAPCNTPWATSYTSLPSQNVRHVQRCLMCQERGSQATHLLLALVHL